ncbi:MAG TPA: hypothetical protein EYP85_15470 [Armatimonadetes bacterium]|nr:hypothetical protein [Armatimonadota bacterium]
MRIAGSAHLPPDFRNLPRLMVEFVDWLNRAETQLVQEPERLSPIVVAAAAEHALNVVLGVLGVE